MGDDGESGAKLSGRAIEWLVALDCGTADEQAFDAWRNADPRHAAAFAQVAATWRRTADPRLSVLLDQPADPGPPVPALLDPPAGLTRRMVAGGAVAAVLGLGGAGAFLAWPRRAYAETGVGERQIIPLPDGSHAMLNTDTRVAWHFGESRDFWVESGEAALLVRASRRPFQLRSDPIQARLSGGKFTLRLDPRRGSLLVLAGSAIAAVGTIHAGSALTVDDGNVRVAAVSPDAIAVATAWQNGKIVFNGMTLDRAVAEFNRYLPHKIVVPEGELGATRLGGEFLIDDPDAFLIGLRDGFDIDHRHQGDEIVLFRKRL